MAQSRRESFLSLAISKCQTSSDIIASSDKEDVNNVSILAEDSQRLEAEHKGWKEIHGFRGSKHWNAPFRLKKDRVQHECPAKICQDADYEDEPYVLHQKVKLLAQMLLASRNCCVCSGRGLATVTGPSSPTNTSPHSGGKDRGASLQKLTRTAKTPTVTHFALAALHSHGHIHYWVQQYHDGLPQQCGYPQEKLNEIHGSRFDPSNPMVQGGGTLREDLYKALLEWEGMADMCMKIGSTSRGRGSRSRGGGMSSDRVFRTVARRGQQGMGIGGVIIGLQRTADDHLAALRIFARSDHVMEALLGQLRIGIRVSCDVPERSDLAESCQPLEYVWQLPSDCLTATADVFRLPRYDVNGNKFPDDIDLSSAVSNVNSSWGSEGDFSDRGITLDLQKGSLVEIRAGRHRGCVGEVVGKTTQGHYRILFQLRDSSLSAPTGAYAQAMRSIGGTEGSSDGPRSGRLWEGVLGLWWLESAARGGVPSLPVTNC